MDLENRKPHYFLITAGVIIIVVVLGVALSSKIEDVEIVDTDSEQKTDQSSVSTKPSGGGSPSKSGTVDPSRALSNGGIPAALFQETKDAGTGFQAKLPTAQINYTETGFSPPSLVVPVGQTIRFLNMSPTSLWVSSESDPSLDSQVLISRGGMYEFTFTKAGTWKYSNKVNSFHTGYVTAK